jgi:hypothetical protein
MTLSRSIEGLITEYSFGGKWRGIEGFGAFEEEFELVGGEEFCEKEVPWPSGVACSRIGLSIAAIGEDMTCERKFNLRSKDQIISEGNCGVLNFPKN